MDLIEGGENRREEKNICITIDNPNDDILVRTTYCDGAQEYCLFIRQKNSRLITNI